MSVLINLELTIESWHESFTRKRLDKVGTGKLEFYGIIYVTLYLDWMPCLRLRSESGKTAS